MKDFITYELALELKQIGFDEPCFAWYDSARQDILNYYHANNSDGWLVGNNCSAPTYSQAFRWFREKYGLASQFAYYHVPKWTFEILEFTDIKMTPSKILVEYSKPRTYEEAELACLEKLIEIVNGGNK
jgi:hypothetical protein